MKDGCRNILPGVEFQWTAARRPPPTGHPADLHPASDYKCFNSSNVSIHSWSWNYRSCWHQTCPPVVTHNCVWIASIASPTGHKDRRDCCSSSLPHQNRLSIGQFACLLPTLVVVAVSQAPSPESNPDSPSPVIATVVHYTTVTADRSEVCMIKQCCDTRPPLCQRSCPGGTSLSQPRHATVSRCWSSQQLGAIHHRQNQR